MYISTNRTLCDVLSDMRKCDETKNYAPMLSLIEEVQILGNRMEAGLYDGRDILEINKEKTKVKKELRELEAKREALKETGDE